MRRLSALASLGLGDREEALREVEEGLKLSPEDANLNALEKLLTKRVDASREPLLFQKAIKSFLGLGAAAPEAEKSAALSSKSPLYASPVALAPTGKSPPMDILENALESNNSFLTPSGLKTTKEGILKLQLGDPAQAERFFTEKIREHPDNWLAYRLRAMARRNLKNLDTAYADASIALKLNPKDHWSLDVRALILLDMGRYEEAASDATRSIGINPQDANAFRARALALEKMGRTQDMLTDLKSAAELDPQFQELYREALESQRGKESPQLLGLPLPLMRTSLGKASPWILALLALLLARFLWVQRQGLKTHATPMRNSNGIISQTGPINIDGFKILQKLGQGGMGEVYEALDVILQRKVAIKKMRREIADDPREKKRFIREAQTVASLTHPNIVQIHTVLEHPDGLYLVFELVPGQPLNQILKNSGALPVSEAWKLIQPMGTALDYAHAQGILHRDFKPSNVMVADNSVKVMDFGIARHVQQSISTLSREEIMGTPAYMAPEQETGQAVKESDLYALGSCFYEMLAGAPPFPGPGPYLMKVQKIYRPLSEAASGISQGIDGILDTILDPKPEKRFHSAQEFLKALQKVLFKST